LTLSIDGRHAYSDGLVFLKTKVMIRERHNDVEDDQCYGIGDISEAQNEEEQRRKLLTALCPFNVANEDKRQDQQHAHLNSLFRRQRKVDDFSSGVDEKQPKYPRLQIPGQILAAVSVQHDARSSQLIYYKMNNVNITI
jgi:hypothetical protein